MGYYKWDPVGLDICANLALPKIQDAGKPFIGQTCSTLISQLLILVCLYCFSFRNIWVSRTVSRLQVLGSSFATKPLPDSHMTFFNPRRTVKDLSDLPGKKSDVNSAFWWRWRQIACSSFSKDTHCKLAAQTFPKNVYLEFWSKNLQFIRPIFDPFQSKMKRRRESNMLAI